MDENRLLQWRHDSSTKAASACSMPKHVMQRLWPSSGARKRLHPETHGWNDIFKKTQNHTRVCSFREICSFRSAEAHRGTTAATPSHQHQRWKASSPERSLTHQNSSQTKRQSGTIEPLGLSMLCTRCLIILTLRSAAAGCNHHMPMCICSFSLHSK